MSEFKLIEQIVDLSEADNWDTAKLEWVLREVYREDEPHTCLCGHFPINELCVIQNKENGKEAIVGNFCVHKFMGLSSDRIFQGLKRIAADSDKALNADAIHHAHDRGWINDWERDFYLDTWRKKKLSLKQVEKRRQINASVLRLTTNTLKKRQRPQ